jgi:hypothetical protein
MVRQTRMNSVVFDQFRPLPGGRLLVHGYMRTPEAAGWPLHLLDSAGDVLRSFGADTPRFDPRPRAMNGRAISLRGDDGVCSAFLSRYQLQCWSFDGQKTLSTSRVVEWFPSFEQYLEGMYDEKRSQTVIMNFAIDNADRAWLSLEVADANWRPRRPEDRPPRSESGPLGRTWVTDSEKYVDAVYEVIDLKSGTILASQRDGRVPGRFISSELLVRPRETDNGFVVFDVFRPRIVGARLPSQPDR